MTANNGWPDKPGVPMNPEKDGWHWVMRVENNRPFPLEWTNDWNGGRDYCWAIMGSGEPEDVAKNICYLGPVLTPDETANREDAKWHEGYAVGVLDVRRGTAFGEPDPHYAALQKRCEEAERERDVFFNRLGRITEALGLPMDATAQRIIEAIQERVDNEREACASVEVRLTVPEGAETWTPLEAWEEALIAFDEAFRDAIRAAAKEEQ